MKLITRDTDYAIRALTCIAGSDNGKAAMSELVRKLEIPRPFSRKILQALTKKGFLESYKGKGGGFALTKKPDKINIFQLVETFQGPFQLSEHLLKGRNCPRVKTCYLKKRMDKIEKDVIRELKSITIMSMVKK